MAAHPFMTWNWFWPSVPPSVGGETAQPYHWPGDDRQSESELVSIPAGSSGRPRDV